MQALFQQHPIIASLITFIVAVLAGTADLTVVKSRALAIIFWTIGLWLVLMPIVGATPLGQMRWVFVTVISAAYIAVVVFVYQNLGPTKSDDQEHHERQDEGNDSS